MKLLLEMIFLCILYQLSVLFSYLLPLPVPPVLIGMGVLLLLLVTKVIRPEHLQRSSQFFSRHMMLFFIPVIVGIVQYWGVLQQGGWHLMFTVVISTAFVLISTALITMMGKKRRELK
ncbi:CidA/LrgA family protein [Aneurinibacillus tyrosinisolvens]|uniref:CidA/LrgA family protein n=1 Tax=Aneurinibacillus tyrosinisolvens TaxID=1443435 RepID=UPI00063F5445|nr:CidA/LrgA family protein [Aneurinibacillus tyrosinisolvens]